MNLKSLRLRHFLSYKNVTIDFSTDNVYNLVGETGSGKSAIRDAISWCLFGKSRVSGSGDALIYKYDDVKDMDVILEMDINNILYTITRYKELGKTTKLNIMGEESENKNTFRETQEHLIQLLGFDYDVFINTVCFEQGKSDSFSQLNPREAKQLIMKLLQLQKYEVYKDNAQSKLSKAERELRDTLVKKQTIEEMSVKQIIDEGLVNEEIKVRQGILTELKVLLKIREECDEVKKQITELQRSKEKFLSIGKCPTCLQQIVETHKEHITNIYDKKIKILKDKRPDDGEYNTRDTRLEISNIERIITQNKTLLAENKKRTNAEKGQIVELEKTIDNLRKEISIYEKLQHAFGRNGVPSLIINNCIPEIECTANTLLEELEIDMQIGLNLSKELKSGELGDTLEILVYTNKGALSYFNYSGGERFIIDLVLRISLSLILLHRKGCSNSTLIIDEGFGSLDKSNCGKALKLISIISKKYSFKKILIISHILEIQDNIGKRINIIKRGSKSFIDV